MIIFFSSGHRHFSLLMWLYEKNNCENCKLMNKKTVLYVNFWRLVFSRN